MAIPFLQRKMAVLVGILHKCGGAFGRMDSGGEKEAVHGLPCTAEGDKGSVHSGALVAQEEHGHRAGAAMGADDGADVAQANLALQVGKRSSSAVMSRAASSGHREWQTKQRWS